MVRSLYNSYIRAIRWASDRIGNAGVVGFVTNAGFLNAISSDGMRRCLADEFSSIYVFHLRGNQRTAGELSRKEGGKIFGSGSRAPIAISLLVKNPSAKQHGQINFYDIGDYLSKDEKLTKARGRGKPSPAGQTRQRVRNREGRASGPVFHFSGLSPVQGAPPYHGAPPERPAAL